MGILNDFTIVRKQCVLLDGAVSLCLIRKNTKYWGYSRDYLLKPLLLPSLSLLAGLLQ
jgi:hypothetical protein